MERVGVVRIIIEHLLCSQLDIISFNPLTKTHEVDILTPLLRIQKKQVQRFIELVHATQLGRGMLGSKPALSGPSQLFLIKVHLPPTTALERTTQALQILLRASDLDPGHYRLRTWAAAAALRQQFVFWIHH